jgi:WD40 repeat protein
MECPGNFVFRGHSGKISCISWLPDDSGFYSCSADGVVNEFVLNNSSLRS